MITNPDWLKPKEKPYFHQISLVCIEKLVECMESFEIGELDDDTCSEIEKQILTDEIDDPEFLEFAIENFTELLSYIESGRVNIRIHRDVTGEMWFGVDYVGDS
ncbi:MAG: hypothetical protein ACE5KZ_00170 [Candidatus Scalinduaceae bacterium]